MKKTQQLEQNHWWYPLVYLAAIFVGYMARVKKAVCRRLGIEPKINSFLVDGLGPKCRIIKEGAASWVALHAIYNLPYVRYEANVIGKSVDLFWDRGLKNTRGVRNRLRIVSALIRDECVRLLKEKKSITILSLACGSAEAVFEAVASLGADKDRVRICLLDHDQSALDYVQREADRLGVAVTTTKASVARMRRVFQKKADIVEMVGLLDYLDDGTATRIIEMIHNQMTPGGMFITANIIPNEEVSFVRHCLDWEMIYREPTRLKKICGFVFNSTVELKIEPLEIHCVAVCRR